MLKIKLIKAGKIISLDSATSAISIINTASLVSGTILRKMERVGLIKLLRGNMDIFGEYKRKYYQYLEGVFIGGK